MTTFLEIITFKGIDNYKRLPLKREREQKLLVLMLEASAFIRMREITSIHPIWNVLSIIRMYRVCLPEEMTTNVNLDFV